MKLVFATNNANKLKEVKQIFSNWEILSLKDIGFNSEIEETGSTFYENSMIKAVTLYNFLRDKGLDIPVVSDDSGLCVDELNGAPGVFSARFSAEGTNETNRTKLLQEMANKKNRSARFECCAIAYLAEDKIFAAIGKVDGEILHKTEGEGGFAYDSIFYCTELKKSFGNATMEEKNLVSHRARAFKALREMIK